MGSQVIDSEWIYCCEIYIRTYRHESDEENSSDNELKVPKYKEIDTVLTTEELIDILNKTKKFDKE